eukprot:GDKH01004528.1.p1 GENE.GDKH01004528.1~~GDKH01004528.1.p1  ORF type:complete len:61 (+),score=5.06 GDKH01004528.1:70-252(+)
MKGGTSADSCHGEGARHWECERCEVNRMEVAGRAYPRLSDHYAVSAVFSLRVDPIEIEAP